MTSCLRSPSASVTKPLHDKTNENKRRSSRVEKFFKMTLSKATESLNNEEYLFQKSRSLQGTDPWEAKSWIVTSLLMFPRKLSVLVRNEMKNKLMIQKDKINYPFSLKPISLKKMKATLREPPIISSRFWNRWAIRRELRRETQSVKELRWRFKKLSAPWLATAIQLRPTGS